MSVLPEFPDDARTESGDTFVSPSISRRANAVEISWARASGTLVLPLPESVIDVVMQYDESSGQIQNPAETLDRQYREWEDGTSPDVQLFGKHIATCYGNSSGDPMLLFWTLEHFSDPDFPLNKHQKRDLLFHTFDEVEAVLSCHVSELMGTDTTESLEYCWYFLVRLLVIEAQLAARRRFGPAVARHVELIQLHYGLLIRELAGYHALGWITTVSPKDDVEGRLIDLAARYPELRSIVSILVRNWSEFEQESSRMHHLAELRKNALRRERETDDVGSNIQRSAKAQETVMRKIRRLERAMTPESNNDPAWHHPIEYFETLVEGRHVLFLDPAIAAFRGNEFSNGQKLEFSLMEHLADHGFRHWLFSEPEVHVHSVHRWLKGAGDSRSLKSLVELVQQYLNRPVHRAGLSLRDLLTFPMAPEPEEVTQEIRYWAAVSEAKERAAAEVRV